MCQQQQQEQFVALCNNDKQKMKSSYSIKKVLKTFFKKQSKQQQHHQQQQQHYHHHQQQQICQCDNCSSNYTTSTSTSSADSFENLDNYRNMQAEQQQYFTELEDNAANEKLAVMCEEDADDEDDLDIYVPVRFARTEAGTFFWTTNLQPVTSTIMPSVDEDLVQPAYCYSNYQYPLMQFQDRWAQA